MTKSALLATRLMIVLTGSTALHGGGSVAQPVAVFMGSES